jgi:hypothetical protein
MVNKRPEKPANMGTALNRAQINYQYSRHLRIGNILKEKKK